MPRDAQGPLTAAAVARVVVAGPALRWQENHGRVAGQAQPQRGLAWRLAPETGEEG